MAKQKIAVESTLTRNLKKAVTVLLYVVLVTPLLVSSEFFFPYITTKTLFFRLIVEIAFSLYIFLAVLEPRFRPRWGKIEKIVLIYLGIVFITSVFGLNFYRSFWGNVERGEGILTLLHVGAYFFILANLLRSTKQWQYYFGTSIIVAVFASIYALLQRYGIENFLGFRIVPGDASRISGPIGNAAFFAGYIMINAYFAIWIYLNTKNKFLKIATVITAGFLLWIVNATQTRGALLGLVIGILLMAIVYAFTTDKKFVRKWAYGVIICLVILGAGIWQIRDTELLYNTGGLYRLANIERSDITTESRLLTWQASLNGWQDRFWLGYGYENFNIAFNKYFPAEIFRDSGSQIWFDRAHNAVLDAAVQSGIFGLLSYLGIFISAFMSLWRFYRIDPQNNRTTAILLSGFLISYFIQNLFVFDTLGTYLGFYALLAFIVALSHRDDALDQEVAEISKSIKPYRSLIAGGLTIALIFIIYASVIRPARANIKVTKALYAAATQQVTETAALYKEAIEMDTYVTEEARQKLGEAMIGFRGLDSVTLDVRQRAFRTAIDELRAAIDESPYDARNYLFLMAVYNNQPQPSEGSRQEVIRLGEKALELSPTRPQIYFEMGQAAFSLGRFDKGLSYFEKAVELNEFPAESHFNLGLAYYIADKPQEGRSEINYLAAKKKIAIVHRVSLSSMIQILVQKNYLADTIPLYEELLRREPNNETLKQELQEVRRRLGA